MTWNGVLAKVLGKLPVGEQTAPLALLILVQEDVSPADILVYNADFASITVG